MENNTDLVQQIRQLKDYVILDKKDYEKLVQNSKTDEIDNNNSVIEALRAQNILLEQELSRQTDWVSYWKNKYETCLKELQKKTTRWWRF